MVIQISLKRAPVVGALFYLSGLLFLQPAQASECRLDRVDEEAQIKYIHDGDTVWLEDGRKLRVIGVNTPELARDEKPAEPLAIEARNRLRLHLGRSAKVKIRYGREKRDRYGRLLAHVYTPNGENISEWLLRQGLAYVLIVPPNLWHADCYQRAEKMARHHGRGLWSKKSVRILRAEHLSKDTRGFQIIRGRITRVGHSKNTVWLNFGRQFAVRILRKDLHWFHEMDFEKLKGKSLEVRGWVQYHKHQLRMRIKHPAAMQILP